MVRRKVTRGSPPRLARSRRPARSDGPAPRAPRKKKARADSDDAETTLGVYFREMSDLSVMSPEEELAAATRISRLRIEYWKSLMAYAPFAEAMADFLETELDAEDVPVADLATLKVAARAVRDRETRSNKDAFDGAVEAVALVVSFVDTDAVLSDRISADLETLVAGYREGTSLQVRPPRSGSRPFREYVARARRGSAAVRAAKHAFVSKNLRLVVSIARRFNHGKLPLPDLIQEGNIGLLKAVDRFDYRKGFRFSTYGSWWIRHAISRAVADKGRAIRLPVHMLDAHHKVIKARRELEATHGREPTFEELAKTTGLAAAKIEKMASMVIDPPISIDRQVGGGDDDRRIGDFLHDEEADMPGDTLEADSLNDQVRQVIRSLRPMEADILRKRFGLVDDQELTLKQIGEQYSLSRERIRQLQEQALGKVRRELRRREAV
jgi:RNA polymerase primary sigma factor